MRMSVTLHLNMDASNVGNPRSSGGARPGGCITFGYVSCRSCRSNGPRIRDLGAAHEALRTARPDDQLPRRQPGAHRRFETASAVLHSLVDAASRKVKLAALSTEGPLWKLQRLLYLL